MDCVHQCYKTVVYISTLEIITLKILSEQPHRHCTTLYYNRDQRINNYQEENNGYIYEYMSYGCISNKINCSYTKNI